MTPEDVLYRQRLRTFALAEELGSVRAACRMIGIHHSTYYRWKNQAERYGLELLRPRERRQPRMPNATSPLVEQRVVAFALGHPGFGPARIAAELAQPKWGGIRLSHNGVWRILKRHGLNTRRKRLGLVAGYAAPPEPTPPEPQPERHLEASRPGELVQFDCFHGGRLSGTRGTVWQYTAIDVASAYTWAELHTTPRNPSAKWTSHLARRVAAGLAARGWELETRDDRHSIWTCPPDAGRTGRPASGSEFRSHAFGETVASLGARQRFIHAGRPRSTTIGTEAVPPAGAITMEILLEAHRRLLAGTRLAEHGRRIRTVQNWIGGSDYHPCAAAFVPPPHELVDRLLSDLATFRGDDSLPAGRAGRHCPRTVRDDPSVRRRERAHGTCAAPPASAPARRPPVLAPRGVQARAADAPPALRPLSWPVVARAPRQERRQWC